MGNRFEMAHFDRPWTWYVCFHTRCAHSWIQRFLPDRFKHVTAIGYSSKTNTWIFFDPAFSRLDILTARNDDEGEKIFVQWVEDATIVEMNVPPGRKRRWVPGGWCVLNVAHLLALRSRAVLPSGLLRDCLVNGGRIIKDVVTFQPAASNHSRSDNG